MVAAIVATAAVVLFLGLVSTYSYRRSDRKAQAETVREGVQRVLTSYTDSKAAADE